MLGDAKGTLVDRNRLGAPACSNEKELLIGCHRCLVRTATKATNQRQTDCLG